jgi:hypothetical protein
MEPMSEVSIQQTWAKLWAVNEALVRLADTLRKTGAAPAIRSRVERMEKESSQMLEQFRNETPTR